MFDWLRKLFTRNQAEPKPTSGHAPAAGVAAVPEKDAWEGWYDWQGADLKTAVEAEICYVDGTGQRTTRHISIKRFAPDIRSDGSPDFMLLAHCHLRNESRTFLGSRIKSFVALDTGEVVSDIRQYLQNAYLTSPSGRTSKLLERAGDELAVLVYIARADERMAAKEKRFLTDYLQSLDQSVELDPEMVAGAISAAPSRTKLTRIIKALREEGRAEAMLSLVDGLHAARTKPDAFTDAAVALVKQEFAKKPRSKAAPGAAKALDVDEANRTDAAPAA